MDQKSLLSVSDDDIDTPSQSRKFLVVVTAGGKTNATPLFEIARILSTRGHVIEFATLDGQQVWTQDYQFISKIHILGPESSWETVHPSLSAFVVDPNLRPDFIIAGYLVDAVRDMKIEHDIPIAIHWPQMPTNMLPASYISGASGLQIEVLTSEHATIWQRLQIYLLGLRALPSYLRYRSWTRQRRARLEVHHQLPTRSKPDHLLLVNSFFGLEPAKDIPPNVAAIGPVLSETYPALTPDLQSFTSNHKRILYVSLGTHALPDAVLQRILSGATLALQSNQTIDGIIWSIRGMALKQFNLTPPAPHQLTSTSISSLISGANPHIHFCTFAPQRALLAHPSVSIFLTHAGASSTNEAVFHGIPTIALGVYFDQLSNAMKLRDAGVSIPLDRDTFSPGDLFQAIETILDDETGSFAANCQRMQRIARIASRRKYLAADLIEETLADAEGQRAAGDGRGMYLETADMRMSVWKARNWDLWALGVVEFLVGVGVVVVIPVALGGGGLTQ
ncbi:UDP-Glycosyltransferase/glycogen phosphorylase [Aspergillus ellipticus CBS 707.79]|uniref:UDP-Glycosyltransferase/glycogen phosphorylase n=1 Tax=Aspergillus ellipticus CBS 707.79 TaxID=1448320 RepID=A0A319CYQ2_9EURO|nr:UDP-Glycosyltransferase/glycogen phosphorylase [Aspergillus ellipticus CBS 707.79]